VNYGPCPKCGKTLVDRNGKYGPFIGCSGYPSCRYNRKLPRDLSDTDLFDKAVEPTTGRRPFDASKAKGAPPVPQEILDRGARRRAIREARQQAKEQDGHRDLFPERPED
jgi:ssDNA-binding Zn-finger/Zn-ribbon topoisomerase 1